MTPPPPGHTKSTFNLHMLQITRNFVTFQNITNRAHFIIKNHGGKNSLFSMEGVQGGWGGDYPPWKFHENNISFSEPFPLK